MHIPDGFLSVPVWSTLDVAAILAVAWAARRAQSQLSLAEDSSESSARRIPLLGVMGAFVFAAQMINFPVGLGTSGHLVGGALLAIALGPAAAATVLTAVLILQAFLLQDGGIMALGANILNMAVAGVFAGILPYRLWGRGRTRQASIFFAGFLSVLFSAALALTELLVSGVPMPRRLVWISSLLFFAGGLIEGAITLAALRAIERVNPGWVQPAARIRPPLAWAATAAIAALLLLGTLVASKAPDALEAALALRGEAHSQWARKALFGLSGMAILYLGLAVAGRKAARQRSA